MKAGEDHLPDRPDVIARLCVASRRVQREPVELHYLRPRQLVREAPAHGGTIPVSRRLMPTDAGIPIKASATGMIIVVSTRHHAGKLVP
jgi:hypothetical protein